MDRYVERAPSLVVIADFDLPFQTKPESRSRLCHIPREQPNQHRIPEKFTIVVDVLYCTVYRKLFNSKKIVWFSFLCACFCCDANWQG